MKTLTIILLMITWTVQAETDIYVHTFSWHNNRDANYKEDNWGIGARYDIKSTAFDYVTVGTYQNSERHTSNYAGVGWSWPVLVKDLEVGISVGGITGYEKENLLPYAIFVLKFKRISFLAAPYTDDRDGKQGVVNLIVDVWEF